MNKVEEEAASTNPRQGLTIARRVIGIVVAILVVAVAALYTAAIPNPWQFATLDTRFDDLTFGMLLVGAGAFIATWLLAPVRNTALQRGRLTARVITACAAAIGLLAWAVFGFSYQTEELARSDDGERAVVSVSVTPRGSGAERDRQLHVWTGSGLTARDAGHLGAACGPVSARFVTADTIELSTSYGTWEFSLDPETGAPLEVLGPHCADGPVPATLGR